MSLLGDGAAHTPPNQLSTYDSSSNSSPSSTPSPALPPPASGPPGRRRGPGWVAVTAIGLLSALVGGGIGTLAGRDDRGPATAGATSAVSTSAVSTSTIATTPSASNAEGMDIKRVLRSVQPSVTQVVAGRSTGTGFIISADGEVLTNAHVVGNARQVRVRLSGESAARTAAVIGTYAEGDVALLKINNAGGLPIAKLGAADNVEVGDDVVAIGFALGLTGEPTVTRGIVSAKDRSLEQLSGLIQTDAPINRGNSGGPLVNEAGEVIGLNTLSFGAGGLSVENLGFAIPIDDAVAIANDLRVGKQPTSSAFLGVSTNESRTGDLGAQIEEVVAGSAAAEAGLQVGDVIIALDDKEVTGPGSMGRMIRAKGAGAPLKITVLRDGAQVTLQATIGTRPAA
jgi:S1-C subfamily serine protease